MEIISDAKSSINEKLGELLYFIHCKCVERLTEKVYIDALKSVGHESDIDKAQVYFVVQREPMLNNLMEAVMKTWQIYLREANVDATLHKIEVVLGYLEEEVCQTASNILMQSAVVPVNTEATVDELLTQHETLKQQLTQLCQRPFLNATIAFPSLPIEPVTADSNEAYLIDIHPIMHFKMLCQKILDAVDQSCRHFLQKQLEKTLRRGTVLYDGLEDHVDAVIRLLSGFANNACEDALHHFSSTYSRGDGILYAPMDAFNAQKTCKLQFLWLTHQNALLEKMINILEEKIEIYTKNSRRLENFEAEAHSIMQKLQQEMMDSTTKTKILWCQLNAYELPEIAVECDLDKLLSRFHVETTEKWSFLIK
ncbi:hypothetical protein PCE1_004535 [Barthelona sp. PCE]